MFSVCVCVCVYFGSKCLIFFLLRDVFESLICCLDLWLSSFLDCIYACVFIFFEKLFLSNLDSSSTPRLSIELFSCFLSQSRHLSITRSIDRESFCPLNSFLIYVQSIEVGFCSIASRHLSIHRDSLAYICFSHVLHLSIILSSITSYFITFMHFYGFFVIPWSSLIIFIFIGWSFLTSCTLCQSWQKGGEFVVFFLRVCVRINFIVFNKWIWVKWFMTSLISHFFVVVLSQIAKGGDC